MMCNRNCANCPYCKVIITDNFLLPENQPKDKTIEVPEVVEEAEVPKETELVVANNLPAVEERIGEYKLVKNIFGKEVVKKVK